MPATVQVEVTRIVELDEIVDALRARGLDPQVVDDTDHFSVEIPCDDIIRTCDEVYAEVESWIAESGSPFVPMRLDGGASIFLTPPLG